MVVTVLLEGVVWSVEEDSLLLGVPMEVKIAPNFLPVFLQRCNQRFHRINSRLQQFIRSIKLPIQIPSTKRSSEVSKYHSIRVQHWNYLKNNSSQKLLGIRIPRDEVFEKTFHYKRAVAFAWVDPGSYDYDFSV